MPKAKHINEKIVNSLLLPVSGKTIAEVVVKAPPAPIPYIQTSH
ncbi:MAG TPA: hypothetical protein VHC21_02955 [Candidatus Saccharimonadales bacterium]|nr:hypothetical protein [Candidatus Saccharimonadales bacterium]